MKVFLVEEGVLEGFGLDFRRMACERLGDAGHDVVGPWCLPPLCAPRGETGVRDEAWFADWQAVNGALSRANYRQIASAHAVVCLCNRPIGPIVGAAIGFAFALSKLIFVHRYNLAGREELPFDVQADFLCRESGGLVTAFTADIIDVLDRVAARPGTGSVH